jgi:N-acetylglutamate synthase-like GNAT family acetyltransferase
MKTEFRIPSTEEFQQIVEYIREFELDDRDLQPEQFIAAFVQKQIAGFGRLRKHSTCTELCSLGVVTPLRGKGIGKSIVKELIRTADDDIYLSCIIPSFFTPFGFQITENYPSPMKEKLDYCESELTVPECYVIMLLSR